ncbi:hypothetical protein [Streptomyces sp. NBC_01565]|uniref:hypothetical protein n=1 Tax=Streptomyces sp. NBC_01565 TaxID=2975881 RepID=UPI0022599377|nr:hypothetical protein [Streptomyces sp. NBC_01565]MCX4542700.1 hypothetical protein [Streptomyces sp. NBC_01565]
MSEPPPGLPPPPGPEQPWGPRPPAPRRRRRWPWVLLVLALLLLGGCVAFLGVVVHEVSEDASRTVRITYTATGNTRDVDISYSTWRDGNLEVSQDNDATLPWTKELHTKGFIKGGSLTVTLGPDGGTATCTVRVDDNPPITATATGAFASAVCTGF